jgi:uncharacterized membrane protein
MKVSPKTANVLLFLANWVLMGAVIQLAFKVVGDSWLHFPVLLVGFYIVIYGVMRLRSKVSAS